MCPAYPRKPLEVGLPATADPLPPWVVGWRPSIPSGRGYLRRSRSLATRRADRPGVGQGDRLANDTTRALTRVAEKVALTRSGWLLRLLSLEGRRPRRR